MIRKPDSDIPGNIFKLRFFLLIGLVANLIIHVSNGQILIPKDNLSLADSSRKIENSINLLMSRSNYSSLKNRMGQKLNLKVSVSIINGDSIVPKKISIRGQTSLYYRRKSLSFNLGSKATFLHGDEKESMKKFFAISLTMDREYINNRLAFEMMEKVNLFKLYYTFSEIKINDQSEGVYMIVERPQDWAIKRNSSMMLIRRGYNEKVDKHEAAADIPKDSLKKYSGYFGQIYNSLKRYNGEELYKVLTQWIDLEAYMKWMAFNLFVRNQDYTDEVFFYIDTPGNRFNIIPWDYDDLFSIMPHEGNTESRKMLGDKLIFSTEDLLDRKIAEDEFLYKTYLFQFRDLLVQLSPDIIKMIFEKTYAELYPYYSNKEIISMARFDRYGDINLEKLKKDLVTIYGMLIFERESYLKSIEAEIKNY